MLLLVAAAAVFDRVIYPLPTGKLTRLHAHFVYSREGHLLNSFASEDFFWRRPVALDEISPRLVESVIAIEDRWFFYHPGVNPVALVGAAVDNLRAGRIVRGGSTITMQIARMMEPKERTIGHKLIEILRAFQLEMRYSKTELLGIYFDLVPYGGNIEGVGAATHFYFEKTPERLSWSEAAILTAIPASPNEFRPDLHPERARARRDVILERLADQGTITRAEFRAARAEEIPTGRMERPFVAPHFSQMAAARYGDSTVLRTTIDLGVQLLCERLSGRYRGRLVPKGIHNLAVVVLDNATGDILGLVGSPDFSDERHHGQINGALAGRSPGSALKPFAYALGFEKGLITPASMLDDIPVSYSGYAPENYDEKYHGVVSAREALRQSFNVPAVNLAAQVGLAEYHGLLRRGGLAGLEREYYRYGLPLVLGACEISLLDLTNLYASMAREGLYRRPRLLGTDTTTGERRLLSAEACYLTTSILAELERPAFASTWEFTSDLPQVAWKTGTSYGRKDAWTIGYNPVYTVGVWAGNFSGEGSPELVGAETAAPLLFEIFDELMRGREPVWFERPPGAGVREVCAVSGMPPAEWCPVTRPDLYIEGVSPVRRCDVHQRILVDHNDGYRLCRACAWGHTVDTVITEQWPARLTGWLVHRSGAFALPEHNPECTGVIIEDAPVITSPESGVTYRLAAERPVQYQRILFRASAAPGARTIHWFLDSELFASREAGAGVFYDPEVGRHELMAVDDLGRSSTVSFEVE